MHFAHNKTSSRAHAILPCICFARGIYRVSRRSSATLTLHNLDQFFVCICHVRNHIFHLLFFLSLFICPYVARLYRRNKKETGIFSMLQRLWSFFVFSFCSFVFFSISNYKTCVSIDKSMGRRTNRERK